MAPPFSILACMSAFVASILTAVATSPKIVHFPLSRSHGSRLSSFLLKRDGVLSTLTNNGVFYYINITVGTPPQNLGVQLDTGSSDTWVISAADTLDCEPSINSPGCVWGVYNQNESSTYALVSSGDFSVTYGDGSGADGDFITDDVGFGDNVTITSQQMGLANFPSGDLFGLMGIGLDVNEASASSIYPTIIDSLQAQSFINSRAYSLWLDDLSSSTGSILFGGIDRSKYLGDLLSVPLQPDASTGTITSFTVFLTEMDYIDTFATTTNIYSGPYLPVLLDSGTTLTYLPDLIINPILALFNATTDSNSGYNAVPCALKPTATAILNFTFGAPNGPVISLPLTQLILDPVILEDGTTLQINDQDSCLLGLYSNARSGANILGDSFLRAAYVVYDLDNLVVGMANADFESGCEDVVEYSLGELLGSG